MARLNAISHGFGVLSLLLCSISSAVGLSSGTSDPIDWSQQGENGDGLSNRAAPNFYARIMPLGASIVWGYNTPEGNSFRKPLRDELVSNGWRVDMVGSKEHGTMADNVGANSDLSGEKNITNDALQHVEAHSGDTIDMIHKASLNSVKYQPNLILINAGNNDCNQHINVTFAGYRMNQMLDELYAKIPGVTIVLSTLVLSTNPEVEKDRPFVNNQYRDLVKDRRAKKDKIVLAEMVGTGSDFVEKGDLTDGVHPNDNGHRKMGHIFYQAIVKAQSDGLITEANKSEFVTEIDAGKGTNKGPDNKAQSTVAPTTVAPPSPTSTKATTSSTTTTTSTSSTSSTTSTTSTSTTSTTSTSASGLSSFGAILHTKEPATTLAAATNNAVASAVSTSGVSTMTTSTTAQQTPSTSASAVASTTSVLQSAGTRSSGLCGGAWMLFIATTLFSSVSGALLI
ncbi:hypothetical protein JX265_008038 [Neoarthrinium moseri]|uniref:SGNH hydrolase-type esterase domain-containing protein n=1 Tax=Neoarthrinium moseri TaxID=1658444 RepID=A0A9P9WIX6_9PEZI|nr:hypothetical protein JX265_008038 [Neoarthrinium moseri]